MTEPFNISDVAVVPLVAVVAFVVADDVAIAAVVVVVRLPVVVAVKLSFPL